MLEANKILQQRYKLKQKLAQNAGRQTWLAEDISIQPAQTVVIKFLAFSEQMQWQDLKLFEREADTLKQLSHPRIPKYLDYFNVEESNTLFALVEEYIRGYSLKELIESKHKITEEELRSIANQILDILCYLHSLNPPVIHRDIKPSNLIFGEDKRVYLVDFGAVQDSAAIEGATFTVVGTYGYAPMEQFGGKTVPASDLYALGATLIHLATGKAPADLTQQNMRIQFQDKVSLSPNFINWIEKLTEPDIQQRFSDATLALNSLKSGIVVNDYSTSKPHGSRIKLNKSNSQLEIYIPPKRNTLVGIVLIVINILVFLFAILILIAEPIAGLICLIFVPVMAFIFLTMTGGCNAKFNRDTFEIKWKVFGFAYRKKIGKTSAIHKVGLKFTGTSINDERVKKISIEAGVLKYDFAGQLLNLENIEKAWLVREINDWLKFPTLTENHQRQEQDALKSLPPMIRNWVEKKVEADRQEIITASKPSRSKIQLNQSYEQLEIKIPPRGIRFGNLFFLIPFIYIFSSAVATAFYNPEAAIISFIIAFVLSLFLLPAFVSRYIVFNRTNFIIQRKLFGLTLGQKIEKTSTIHNIIEDESGIEVNDKPVPMITIKSGVIKYSFGSFAPRLTPGEINWLIKEMKAWLGIKL